MKYQDKLSLKKAFLKLNFGFDKKELYRLLTVAEKFDLVWGTRNMYGGGIEVSLNDNHDTVLFVYIHNEELKIDLNDEYFEKDFKPSYIQYYSDEQLAEIRNEEALYGYELPHFRIVKG